MPNFPYLVHSHISTERANMEKPSDYKLLAINLTRAAHRAEQEDINLSIIIKVGSSLLHFIHKVSLGVESRSGHFSFIFTRIKKKDLENF